MLTKSSNELKKNVQNAHFKGRHQQKTDCIVLQ
jgi:hypothetical protein